MKWMMTWVLLLKDRGISGVKDELLVLLSLGIWSPKKDGK